MGYMDNSILNKNIEALKKYYPEIAEKTEKYISEQKISENVFVDKAVDGSYIAGVVYKGRDWYLNSRYNPVKAAKDWAAQYDKVNFQSIFIIMGMANGMYERELLNKFTKTNTMVLYEPEFELFCLMVQYIDVSDVITDKRVRLIVGDINAGLITEIIVRDVDYSNMGLLKYVAIPNYEKIYIKQWHDIVEKIKDKVSNIVLNRNTQISFKYELVENMFTNYRDMIQQYTINQIKDEIQDVDFENVPAILVAAGPSLDKNIMDLAKARGKAFIIAVDTALNSMAKAGIVPDMSITIDPHKPISLFQNESMRNVPMVVCQYSSSDVIDALSCKRFYTGEMDYMASIYLKYGKEVAALLETGGSVANTAFSFLQYLGFKNIILVGQDLAYTGNKNHTAAAYNGLDNEVRNTKNTEMVDAVGGGKVLTSKVMHAYNSWFEGQIDRYPELNVINATEGGAIKRGSIEMTLKDAIDKFCVKQYEFADKIENIKPIFSEEEQKSIWEEFGSLYEEIDKCIEKINDGIKSYNKFIDLYKKNKIFGEAYKKVLKDIENINNYTDNNPVLRLASVYNALENYEVQAEVYNVQDNPEDEAKKIHSLGIKMLESYKDALDEMKNDIKYLVNSGILRKFVLGVKQTLENIDYASYEYRKQNIYKGSIEFEKFCSWIKYVVALYLNHAGEMSSYNLPFNISEIVTSLQKINCAMENKDYILVTDILQYDVKNRLIYVMSDIISKNMVELESNERENMSILKAVEPLLYSQLTDKDIKGKDYSEEFTSYAYMTLKRNGDNEFYFHSNQNPKLEARIQLNSMKFEHDIIAIVGIGLGYIIEELIEIGYSGKIFVFETDINVIKSAIKVMNLRQLYSNYGIRIVYDPMLTIFSETLKKNDVDVFFHRPSIRNIENDAVRKIVEETEMNINSAKEQTVMLQSNLSKNIKQVEYTLDDEVKNIQNKTVICVAGGASLDNNIEELKLKSMYDNIIIISVGTVYKKLRNAGIIPEYVLITDAKESMKSQITDVDSAGTILLYLSTVNKTVIDTWKGEKRIVFQNGMDDAELYALRRGLITVDTGGSVATTAISIAVKLGASRVICVGLDLAFINGYTHASGANAKKIENNENMRKVKSVNGEEIPTYTNLDIYRHWIEQYIKDIDNVEFINCSGGAYIEGMINMNLSAI